MTAQSTCAACTAHREYSSHVARCNPFLLLCMSMTSLLVLLGAAVLTYDAHHLAYILHLCRHQELRESAVRGIAGPGKVVSFCV